MFDREYSLSTNFSDTEKFDHRLSKLDELKEIVANLELQNVKLLSCVCALDSFTLEANHG